MPNYEYNYNDTDYQLIASEEQRNLGLQDYIRLSVYDENSGALISLPTNRSIKAIFYSSLSEFPFNINISPFNKNLSELNLKTLGGDNNDFKIYKSSNGDVYVKPNDIFNDFELPQGNYKLQIEFKI